MRIRKSYVSACVYCLCYVKDISTDISEDQVAEEIDPYLDEEEDIVMDSIREDHWRDIAE